MTSNDKFSPFIDHVLAHLRGPLESDLHALALDFAQQAEADRVSAVEEAVAVTRREAQIELDRLREELEQVRRTAEAEVTDIRQLAVAEIEGARRQTESQLDDAQRQSAELLIATRRESDEAIANLERVQRELDDARRAAEHAGREHAALQQSLDEVRHAATLASETLSGVAARTQQIVDTVRGVDGAVAIGDVLERVALAAKSYAQRSALLMVRGSRLTIWRTSDFPGLTDLSVDAGGMIAAAVTHHQPQTRFEGTPDADAPLPPFAADARASDAVALPIVLGGETVAVLYADSPRGVGEPSDRRWPLALEIVTRYASRVIETITLQRSLGLSPAPAAPRDAEPAS